LKGSAEGYKESHVTKEHTNRRESVYALTRHLLEKL
jgi:hypothetical protein